MPNSLENLRKFTTIVADTGDFEASKEYKPTDVTTNPLIILAASKQPRYQYLVDEAVQYGKKNGKTLDEQVRNAVDMMNVVVGRENLKLLPGRVHTQVDARICFDKAAMVNAAVKLVKLYAEQGVSKEKVAIKIPSTWEGIQAAKELRQKYGISSNMTVHFNIIQAAACAEAGVDVVSPFIGGTEIWYKENTDKKTYTIEEHLGIQMTKNIFYYFRKFGYKTVVLGAYIRNIDEMMALAGVDMLTIPLNLLEELKNTNVAASKQLDGSIVDKIDIEKIELDEAKFRYLMNEDQMATEMVSKILRLFCNACKELDETFRGLMLKTK